MQIRQAELEDLGGILDLEASSFPDPWGEALVRPGVAGDLPTTSYLVASDDSEVPSPEGGSGDIALAGFAVLALAGDIADLQRIAVREEARRTGVASALLTEAVLRAAASRADRLLVEVRADNRAALSFYAARDFVEIDRRTKYYADGADAVIMRRALGRGCGGSR